MLAKCKVHCKVWQWKMYSQYLVFSYDSLIPFGGWHLFFKRKPTLLNTTEHLFCKMSFNLCLSEVSWRLYSGYAFWQEFHRSDSLIFLLHLIKWHAVLCLTITDGVNFDHIAKMVSAKLLHFKVTVLPFVINKYLWGDTLTMQTFCFSSYFSSPNFSIQQ